ncbi:helix-turn-helix domain-containing protein [Dysgonomonas sp. OttesenSCG-928-D17]|nr:helix-turn-helix domain-containing protein [Dysgonomonas sp. OttesenSCG-928-D17]
MEHIAKAANNSELEAEAVFMRAVCLPDGDEGLFSHKIKKLEEIADKSAKNGNISLRLRAMESIFDLYWNSEKYARAFSQIHSIDKVLQNVGDDKYPGKGVLNFRIGEAYYFFQDYDKAIPYLRKAMKPSRYYFDRSNLEARNMLGTYYNQRGQVDSAEYYFRSAFSNHDRVKFKSKYDAVSLSNLGHSFIQKKDYDEGISYFRAGLNHMLLERDYKSASDVTVGLAQCYLEKDNLKKAKHMIDSSLIYIEQSGNVNAYQELYPLMCEYYVRSGDRQLAKAYLDSTMAVNNKYLEKYNSKYIIKAEQELFEAETIAKDEELRYQEEKYTYRLLYGLIILVFISLGLVVFIILYNKNKKAYRALVQKNQDWAGTTNPGFSSTSKSASCEENANEPDTEDLDLMKQVYDLVNNEKVYKDLDLTLDSLSRQINVNRNYLSKAINKTTGKNFNTYINEHRIKEAIKIMSNPKSDLISIDAIALEVGFGNRISFYQSFKKITGLTPSDFRNNKSNVLSN